ncbi:hypothetical protein [Aquidulcibacter sp.]|uniref:hypothetical protein n=1 Tax=Aquidulcibacter sp. TaxID=2052990 RepID=UPI0025C6BE4C|nr:hypothetical protein [Aquidulcibacter sp.]MCA3694311.1 hypothetical protein [Aquidulcibacter sp.]
MSNYDLKAQIKIRRVAPDHATAPHPSETAGWFALGLVIAFVYLIGKAFFTIEWSRPYSGSGSNGVYLPEPLNASRKIKIPAGTTQEFKVDPGKRLVVSWRNPYQCDQDVLLTYRPSANPDAVLKTEVLAGLGGNKIFPQAGETSWIVQWQLRDTKTAEAGCKNANYGAMPENAEVFGFTERIPAPAPTPK